MSEFKVIDGNYAAAYISYLFTEVAGIYPITPSSKMPDSKLSLISFNISSIWIRKNTIKRNFW